MPHYRVTAQARQVHQLIWEGDAPSRQFAEREMMRLHTQAMSGEDVSGSGLQIYGTDAAIHNVKSREVDMQPRREKTSASRNKPPRDLPGDRHPLYTMHTTWRSLTPQEQRQFLLEMLTENQRRFIARGFVDDEEE